MKAQVYINRHLVTANKKATKDRGLLIDEAAISVNTYLGVVYGKEVKFTKGCKLVQDATNARCSGATIWMEAEFESLVIRPPAKVFIRSFHTNHFKDYLLIIKDWLNTLTNIGSVDQSRTFARGLLMA